MTTQAAHRRIDHQTSIEAARRLLPRVSETQREVLDAHRRHHAKAGAGLTDGELETMPQFARRFKFSTIRKRRRELVEMGYIRSTGRKREGMTVWEPVPAGEIIESPPTKGRRREQETAALVKAGWDDNEAGLIDWFREVRGELPTDTFRFAAGEVVTRPALFYEEIERDIRAGASGPRSRTGALRADLQRLHQLFSQKGETA